MKQIFLTSVLMLAFLMAFGQDVESLESLVIKHQATLNSRNIDAFMATLSPDIEFHALDGTLIRKGFDEVKKYYGDIFNGDAQFHLTVIRTIVVKNKVVEEHELKVNDQVKHGVVIFEIVESKITRITFVD